MDINQRILISIQKLSLVLAATAGKDLEKRNVNQSEFLILSHLKAKGKAKTQKLAEITMVTSGGITYHINSLVKKNFIQKEKDPNDKRISWISIKPDGLAYLSDLMKGHTTYLEQLFETISEEDKLEFYNQVKKIGKTLEKRGTQI